ncbi:hypothetical protein Ddye_017015 [Dipteronia dyeriana]|uniref:DUF4283 domain-containing protein n=1 Tax=Dipteronia dyeriana TaxID=168575 RepID=A0AAD9U7U1_9ROSI|nr:hypothetical protein Ddye_017015 [Dipteronia dyeriana]
MQACTPACMHARMLAHASLQASTPARTNGSTKRGHCSSIPKLVLNNAINHARNGHSTLNRVVAEAKGFLSSSPQTSTIAANLGNNGGLEDSSFAAQLKNELGKMKGIMNQCNRSEKPALDVHRPAQPHQVSFSSFGMVEKPTSKGEACPSAIVEDQKVQQEEVSSLSNYVLPYNEGISITPHLVNKDASNAIGQLPLIIFKKSPISYSNVLKGAHHDPLMDPPSSRPMNLKYFQPFHSGNRKCVSPPLEVAKNGSKAWRNCLVGYFIEKKLPFYLIDNIAMRIWGNRGLLEVLANDNGLYFFKFSDDEACYNVLEAGPWLFVERMVILKKWHPRLNLSKDSNSKILVWDKLFNIPYEYWSEEGLSHIASAVGKPLYADSLTESMKRISFARFATLVEDGDNRNDQCNDQSNDQCNNVDPPSMASPDQCKDQCNDVDSPTTASPDHSLWHSKIKNIDGVTVKGLSSPTESSSKKKKNKWTTKKGKVNSL